MVDVTRRGDGPIPARILLVGEYWGEEEERRREPFQGASGILLNAMLHEAGIMRSECYCTNVVNFRPRFGETESWIATKKKDITPNHVLFRDKYVLPLIPQAYERLLQEIELVSPNIIVTLGGMAMWVLTGAWGVLKWRGSQLNLDGKKEGRKLIPTVNPAAVLREYSLRPATVIDLRRAADERGTREYSNVPKWNFIIRPNFEAVREKLEELHQTVRAAEGGLWLDFDLETRAGHIACAGVSWSKTEALCIPLMCTESREGYWTLEEEAEIVHRLYKLLTHPNVKVRGQNLLYDCQYTYRHWHFVPRVAQDTMISHHSCFSGLRKSLAFQASMYCDHYLFWKDDGKTWDKGVGEDALWAYNCVDCVRTREVGEVSAINIEKMGLQEVDAFQQKLFWPVLFAMQRGVRIDKARRASMAQTLMDEMAAREAWFHYVLGHPLNPGSNVQMAKLFYEDLQQPKIFNKPKAGYLPGLTVDAEAMEKLGTREPLLRPLLRKVEEFRSLGVFLRTFVLADLDVDDRMRCSYNICGTETYRFSSSKNAFDSGTNLQNVPAGGEDDESDLELPNIRTIFVPDPGFTWFDTDLSKADLRIVQRESGEVEMGAMLDEGRDPYVEAAQEFYHDRTIKKMRADGSPHPKYRVFKSFAHGCITAGHEVLTPDGWVPIEKYNETKMLAVWSHKTRSIHFEVPKGLNRDWIFPEEDLITFNGQGYSQEVTHDHRMPYTTESSIDYKVCAASEVPKSSRMPVSGFYSGSRVCDPNALRLIAAFQADGSFDYKYRTRWHFRKQRKIDRLIALAKACEIVPQVDTMKDGTTTIKLYWRPADFMKIPGSWLLELDGASLDAWLDELQYWDGHIGDTGAVRVSTVSSEAAEWIQTIAHLRGKGSRRQVRRSADETRQTLWQVSLNDRTHAQVSSMSIAAKKPTEATPVYCPKTSTGFFLIRRKGHISITGNTHYLGTPFGLAKRLGLTVTEVERLQKWYLGRFPGIQAWQKEFKAKLRSRRYVENIFGYRRYYFDRVDEATEREAIAWLPQSTVAVLVNKIWMGLWDEYRHIQVLMQCHDSLAGQFPSHRTTECVKQLEKAAKIVLPYSNPLTIPVGIKISSTSWGECK